ncbi:hypothetical protein [Mesorhizobium sp.]|uniref:hypothetical protein n=1 Tax=Mesorhizobium sp. TaxID=1871066 RepID=UPI000FE30C26|nr:hypothetical protein [Mesorhizobium sp.]RWK39284.1 MAG: hypothetical protein EOR40_04540 [Mesorhizobium sp.]
MSYSNFTNGSLVFRIWRFDGGTEVLAKTQYWDQATLLCEALLKRDKDRGSNSDQSYFYLAVCENEVKAQAFGAKVEKPEAA